MKIKLRDVGNNTTIIRRKINVLTALGVVTCRISQTRDYDYWLT